MNDSNKQDNSISNIINNDNKDMNKDSLKDSQKEDRENVITEEEKKQRGKLRMVKISYFLG